MTSQLNEWREKIAQSIESVRKEIRYGEEGGATPLIRGGKRLASTDLHERFDRLEQAMQDLQESAIRRPGGGVSRLQGDPL